MIISRAGQPSTLYAVAVLHTAAMPNTIYLEGQNTAGIYGAVTRIGRLAVGQTILFRAATEKGDALGITGGCE